MNLAFFFFPTDGNAEAQRGKASRPRAHSQERAGLDSKPGLSDSEVHVLPSLDVHTGGLLEKMDTSQEHFKFTVS